jgi:hypothetical protein
MSDLLAVKGEGAIIQNVKQLSRGSDPQPAVWHSPLRTENSWALEPPVSAPWSQDRPQAYRLNCRAERSDSLFLDPVQMGGQELAPGPLRAAWYVDDVSLLAFPYLWPSLPLPLLPVNVAGGSSARSARTG